jgi:hypothetical protein
MVGSETEIRVAHIPWRSPIETIGGHCWAKVLDHERVFKAIGAIWMSTKQKVLFFLGAAVLVVSACGGGEKPAAVPESGSAPAAGSAVPMDADAGMADEHPDGGMDMKDMK